MGSTNANRAQTLRITVWGPLDGAAVESRGARDLIRVYPVGRTAWIIRPVPVCIFQREGVQRRSARQRMQLAPEDGAWRACGPFLC